MTSCLHRQRAQRRHREGGDDRRQDLEGGLPPGEVAQRPHQHAEHRRRHHLARRRMEDQAHPDREHGVSEDALCPPESSGQPADLGEPAESFGGLHSPSHRLEDEGVQGGDLIQPGRPAEHRRQLDHRRLAGAHRHHQVRREGAHRDRVGAECPGHLRESLLDRVDRLAGRVHGGSELHDEGLQVVQLVASRGVMSDRPYRRRARRRHLMIPKLGHGEGGCPSSHHPHGPGRAVGATAGIALRRSSPGTA